MRPPSARWRSYSGVRWGALGVKRVVDVFYGVGVDDRQQLLLVTATGLGQPDDKTEVGGNEALLACAVAARRLLEQTCQLGLPHGWRHPGLPAQLVHEQLIAVGVDRFGSHRSILRPARMASPSSMFHALHGQSRRWIAILGACAHELRSAWSECFLPPQPRSCRSRPGPPRRTSKKSTSTAISTTSCLRTSRAQSTAPKPTTPTRSSW